MDVAGDRRRDAIFDPHAQDISAAIDDRDDRIAARCHRRSESQQRLHFGPDELRKASHHRVQLVAAERCCGCRLSDEVMMLKCELNGRDIALALIGAAQDVAVEIKTFVEPAQRVTQLVSDNGEDVIRPRRTRVAELTVPTLGLVQPRDAGDRG